MPANFARWSAEVARLHAALARLEPLARQLAIAPPRGEEWFDLLEHKLVPQLGGPAVLVAAVVGGTNIGKSLVFNHLAGEVASGVSPLASRTKHPVCLLPENLCDEELLARLFRGFALRPWHDAKDPWSDDEEDLLFYRVGAGVPPRLLILDSPDVDSDSPVNWRRADHVRQSADVLVAILTQQKYNDAAVKRFFRHAVEAQQQIFVVFNQCDLEHDREAWPQWLSTFCRETGASPERVYACPYDRAAAQSNTLPFYALDPVRDWALGPAASLRADLAELHFDEIKIRTFRGAIGRVLEPARGAPAYMARLGGAADEFAGAAQALSAESMLSIDFQAPPTPVLVEEIRRWWDDNRAAWSRRIHGFYRTVGEAVARPIRALYRNWSGVPEPAIERFHDRERDVVLKAVEQLLERLDRLAQVGSETLRPRLARILGGAARAELLAHVAASHAALPDVDDEFRAFLRRELDQWSAEKADTVYWLRNLDNALALSRPVISVTLVFGGLAFAGSVVHEAAAQATAHSVGQIAAEAGITGAFSAGGEAAVGAGGHGVKWTAAQLFARLQREYVEGRKRWLAEWLERELLGDLLSELRAGAELTASEPFREATAALAALRTL